MKNNCVALFHRVILAGQKRKSNGGRRGDPVRADVKRIEDVTGSNDPVYAYRLNNWVSIYAKQRVAVKGQKWQEIPALLVPLCTFLSET